MRARRVGGGRHGVERNRLPREGGRRAFGHHDLLLDPPLPFPDAGGDEGAGRVLRGNRRGEDDGRDPEGGDRADLRGRNRPSAAAAAVRRAQGGVQPRSVRPFDDRHLLHPHGAYGTEQEHLRLGGRGDSRRRDHPQHGRLPGRLLADAPLRALHPPWRSRGPHGGDRGRAPERRHGRRACDRRPRQPGGGTAGERLFHLDGLLRLRPRQLLEPSPARDNRQSTQTVAYLIHA